MKKSVFGFNLRACLVLAGSMALTGLAAAQTCAPKVPASELVKPGTLVMSTNPTLPPMQFVDSAGVLKGMRITLGDEIAKRLCLKPEYIKIEFSAMVPGLQSGRWDLINTGIFWTEERAKIMQMIQYEAQAVSISVAKGNPLKISKPEDLAGRTVGVELGGFEERKLKELDDMLKAKGLKGINIRTFDNFATAYQALRAGQTEASVTIDSTGAEYAKRGEFDRAISGLFPTPVALALKSTVLANAVVGVFNDMQKDGTYAKLMSEYGLLANKDPIKVNGPSK
ncbi:MAG: ABC transporter substrate-binding protein [Ramlibacter sp.]|jgi:polar amino acid transport system substrate-binding protein|uniref:ABC transporter substrate-binding protein n=1 Tax=Ramlibacter sp. TaxID=1917967 RepID=UPI00261BB10E|nr:ABC transporter substrate-binding protein [Ramlibacter sp.]MDH4375941.1 ABC transporter substrate-binding protein [Ramlibacter sp.]